MGVGMPTTLALDRFGYAVSSIFGEIPYHVGSSMAQHGKSDWRDVDVRLILSDERYAAMGFGDPKLPHDNERWCVIVEHISALGRLMTGLPIDFQIQQQSHANETEKGPRSALGCRYQLRGESRNGPREMHPFDGIKGLQPVDPALLAEYEREMTEEVIPQIISDVQRREALAAEARQRGIPLFANGENQ